MDTAIFIMLIVAIVFEGIRVAQNAVSLYRYGKELKMVMKDAEKVDINAHDLEVQKMFYAEGLKFIRLATDYIDRHNVVEYQQATIDALEKENKEERECINEMLGSVMQPRDAVGLLDKYWEQNHLIAVYDDENSKLKKIADNLEKQLADKMLDEFNERRIQHHMISIYDDDVRKLAQAVNEMQGDKK